MTDSVNHPPHYGGADSPYEAIKVIEAWNLGFHLGNTVKYIARAGRKAGELEDLRKAQFYLARRIAQLEGAAPVAEKLPADHAPEVPATQPAESTGRKRGQRW